MKTKIIISCIVLFLFAFLSYGQHLKKDGTHDMRYKENKQTYVTPAASASTSSTNTNVQLQNGYVKTDRTVVQPHFKTKVNETNTDNFSTKENVNPFTGKSGTRAKDFSTNAQNSNKGKIIERGAKGGQYYINSKGNKAYVPKR